LLLAIVKFDRFEWALEKATELGGEEVTPLAADRSEKGLVAASEKRAERWRRILVESAQQARRLRVPALSEAAKPRDAFRESAAPLKLLLSERAGARPLRDLLEPVAAARREGDAAHVAIAIGPEGGWTDAEFTAAGVCGFSEAALGANILRTETAVCAALAAVQYAFGAFRGENRDP
jgi:16S rRNA (uracil1498-N3)-methyltransferase